MAPIQQILIGGRSISFFTAGFRAVIYGLGFIILFSLFSIFRKLSFQSIHLVQRLMFLIVLYIEAWVLIGSLTGSLLTSGVLIAGGITQAIYGQYSMRICYGLSYISFLKARSLHSALVQYIIFIYGHIRFSIIILISFINKGIRGIVSG